jgi:hypothetical protein
LLTATVLFLIIVVNFGTVEDRWECPGQVRRQGAGGEPVTTAATLYAKVETYRWFVFWADHDAMITWEIRPGGRTGFGFYSHNDFGAPIVEYRGTKQYGSFSPLSKRVSVEAAFDGSDIFDGVCR